MDKNTVVGLVIIGLILSVFTIVNQPSEEELKKQSQQNELALKKEQAAQSKEEAVVAEKEEVKVDKVADSSSNELVKADKGELIRLENEKLIVDFSTKGGKVAAVYLKEFETYQNFTKKASKKPLRLFLEGDAVNQLSFPVNGKDFKTGEYAFEVKRKSKSQITFKLNPEAGQTIEFTYKLKKDAYDLDYTIHMEGFAGQVAPQNVMLDWDVAYRKTERLFSEQRRVSTICYNYDKEGFDYLSEMSDDDEQAEDQLEWVAYKQSYFSSILRPDNGFAKDGSKLEVVTYKEGESKINTHLKDFKSSLNLKVPSTGSATIKLNWFFGPNDYEVLKAYGHGYDDILNFGWGIFRWINLYAVQPVFNLLVNSGMSIGIAILILTLILKLVLTPIQWKMYVSSAKMRILKPEIEELNAKFPKKEDAMKKQMEMMTLYRESGASPLSGCVPMLIQMPILLAVFRFFPSAFELRQKSFLWAEDLSSYDSIWDFGTYIWPYGDHVSLFTLLMAGTTLAYTFLNSGNMQQPQQPGMPNMKIIMYIFPFMMIFFFNNYSSGLSYYYFVSTLISIIIMLAIKKFFVDEEKLKAKMAARKVEKSTKVKKKSKFQERLENMQKMQQEQLERRKKK